MSNPSSNISPNFQEKFSSEIPTSTLLTMLIYQFITQQMFI